MKRGYPAKAAKTLEVAPQTDEVKLLRGWALVESGKYSQALAVVENLSSTSSTCAVRAMAMLMLSRTDEAKKIAELIGEGRDNAHAYGYLVLAHCARRSGDKKLAINLFNTSHLLFNFNNNYDECLKIRSILINIRTGDSLLDEAYDIISSLAGVNNNSAAIILNNCGEFFSSSGNHYKAIELYNTALEYINISDFSDIRMTLYNNLGVQNHYIGNNSAAEGYYRKAMEMCVGEGNFRLYGIISCNLSEISDDLDYLKGTVDILKINGEEYLSRTITKNLLDRGIPA